MENRPATTNMYKNHWNTTKPTLARSPVVRSGPVSQYSFDEQYSATRPRAWRIQTGESTNEAEGAMRPVRAKGGRGVVVRSGTLLEMENRRQVSHECAMSRQTDVQMNLFEQPERCKI
jgi:hypothetical protein